MSDHQRRAGQLVSPLRFEWTPKGQQRDGGLPRPGRRARLRTGLLEDKLGLRDAQIMSLYEGSSEILRLIISSQL